MTVLSQRILSLSESETLAMTRKSRELQAEGHDVINLSIGEPDFNTPEFIKDAAKKALDDNHTHYPPVPGFQDLREAICRKLKRDNGLDYKPDQIVVSTGAKQAIANLVLCLVDPGDEVLVPTPYWVSYKELIKLAEGIEVNIYATIEQDFKVTPSQIENAITPKTKLIMFNSPCNPTGSVYTKEELEGIANVLAKFPHVFIMSDEIYEHINFKSKHESFAQFEAIRERVITINGVSKGFAMTGWRIGYLAGPKFIADACNKFQGQITSGTCSIAQKASIIALDTDPSNIPELKYMLSAFKERRDLVLELLNEIPGIKTNIPDGAFYIFLHVKHFFGKSDGIITVNNGTDLCMYILNKVYVALVPGDAFGDPNCIRISYATSNEKLKEAVARIKKALADLH